MIQHPQDKKSYGIFTKDEFLKIQKMPKTQRETFIKNKKQQLADKNKKRRW